MTSLQFLDHPLLPLSPELCLKIHPTSPFFVFPFPFYLASGLTSFMDSPLPIILIYFSFLNKSLIKYLEFELLATFGFPTLLRTYTAHGRR